MAKGEKKIVVKSKRVAELCVSAEQAINESTEAFEGRDYIAAAHSAHKAALEATAAELWAERMSGFEKDTYTDAAHKRLVRAEAALEKSFAAISEILEPA